MYYLFGNTKGAFGEFAGFYRWDAKRQAGRIRLFFCDQAALKRYSRLKNQSASIDASGSGGFFFVSEHPKEKNPAGWGYTSGTGGTQRILNASNAL